MIGPNEVKPVKHVNLTLNHENGVNNHLLRKSLDLIEVDISREGL